MLTKRIPKQAASRFLNKEFKEFFLDSFGNNQGLEYCRAFKFKEKCLRFGAVDKGKLVGTITLNLGYRIARIGAFAVAKGRRRIGVGSVLIKKCEAIARKNRCRKIWLWTLPNSPAVLFYKKLGFVEEAQLKKQMGGRDLCVMSKFL